MLADAIEGLTGWSRKRINRMSYIELARHYINILARNPLSEPITGWKNPVLMLYSFFCDEKDHPSGISTHKKDGKPDVLKVALELGIEPVPELEKVVINLLAEDPLEVEALRKELARQREELSSADRRIILDGWVDVPDEPVKQPEPVKEPEYTPIVIPPKPQSKPEQPIVNASDLLRPTPKPAKCKWRLSGKQNGKGQSMNICMRPTEGIQAGDGCGICEIMPINECCGQGETVAIAQKTTESPYWWTHRVPVSSGGKDYHAYFHMPLPTVKPKRRVWLSQDTKNVLITIGKILLCAILGVFIGLGILGYLIARGSREKRSKNRQAGY